MHDTQRDIGPGDPYDIGGVAADAVQDQDDGIEERRLFEQMRVIVRFPVGDGRQYAFEVAAATARWCCLEIDTRLGERAKTRHGDPDQHDERPQDQHRARCEDVRRHMAPPFVVWLRC